MNKFNTFYESIINGVDLPDEVINWFNNVFAKDVRAKKIRDYNQYQLIFLRNKVYPSYGHLTELSRLELKRIARALKMADPEQRKTRNVKNKERYVNDPLYRQKLLNRDRDTRNKITTIIHTLGFSDLKARFAQIGFMLEGAKERAKKIWGNRWQEFFNITPEDVEAIWPQNNICPLLGIPLIRGKGKATNNSPALDQIKPRGGYVKGNIMVMSNQANNIKNNATWQELERIADYMEGKI